MKAVRLHAYGSPEVLVYEDVPQPAPGPGQVLIKVESVAVNYADLMRRRNDPYPFPTTLPFTPGSEVAGVVEALGNGVGGPPPGTSVFALVGHDGSSGYAEYAVADVQQVIPIPPGISTDVASAIVVAGSTAFLTLREVARLQPGETVVVQGAGGGVGTYAVQIAKLLGAGTVIAAASTPTKREAALALGADDVVDYTEGDWAKRVRTLTDGRGVDVMLEMSGGGTFAQGLSCLAPFGRSIVYGMASRTPLELGRLAVLDFFYDPAPNQSLHAFNLGLYFGLRPDVAVGALMNLIEWVASGQVKVPIGEVLPLSQAAEAHRMIEERRTTGKIVLSASTLVQR